MSSTSGSAPWSRREWLLGTSAALGAGVLSGCDDAMSPTDAGSDAGTDAAVVDTDAGVTGPLPPRERSYATFEHGVASGDPLADAVILWTRITTGMPDAPSPASVDVDWAVATDRELSDVVAMGTATTDASRDWTVKVDAMGLSPATTYYYGFSALGGDSPVGRTRTAPTGAVERVRFGLVSCSSLGHGFFHSYAKLAQRADLDAVIHLGDYIYEYGTGGYGDRREYLPAHEAVSLDDYRERYAQYRREPALAEAHRQHPFIAIWDDHETADNSWSGGAENHDASEGAWADRVTAATQVYREWMPIRDHDGDPRQLYRKLGYGDLCDLVVLDTRIWGREEQAGSLTDPEVDDPDRQLLGADQEAWLLEQLRGSTARWKVLAQQVMMGELSGFPNPDQWDGYPAARARLLNAIQTDAIEDVFVLTGDIHSSWAFDLPLDPADVAYDPTTGAGSLAVEVVVPAVSSPGFPPALARAAAGFIRDNRSLHWAELTRRGYVVLDLTEARAQADWFFVGEVEEEDDGAEDHGASWATASGASHLAEALSPAAPRPDAPPLA
ncbi:MAG: alkaline phosphatase D family protein [Sandaracinaceae bacterium]|nr:alkaline phosphatase D family protein [Sandaracinaceae bacterium]